MIEAWEITSQQTFKYYILVQDNFKIKSIPSI